MKPNISAKEDTSSILYQGRARLSEIADISGMDTGSWKERLALAVAKSGKSKRAISLAAGLGPGYVHSILAEGKDPTVENLIKVCAETGVSLAHIVFGYEMSAETETILRRLEKASPEVRDGLLKILPPA